MKFKIMYALKAKKGDFPSKIFSSKWHARQAKGVLQDIIRVAVTYDKKKKAVTIRSHEYQKLESAY